MAICLVGALASCPGTTGDEGAQPGNVDSQLQTLRARTEIPFETIDFVKPRSDEDLIDPYQAPILYSSITESDDAFEFGALVEGDEGLQVDASRPTVYFYRESIQVGAERYEQDHFVWFRGQGAPWNLMAQGVRVTNDSEGFPVFLEVLNDESELDLVYVSKRIELLAAEEFGEAIAGRRFHVEPKRSEGPRVAVVGILDHGPEPLGPIVYSDSRTGDVSQVHCRCNPSNITNIRETIEYDLLPWSVVPEAMRASIEFRPATWPFTALRLPAEL